MTVIFITTACTCAVLPVLPGLAWTGKSMGGNQACPFGAGPSEQRQISAAFKSMFAWVKTKSLRTGGGCVTCFFVYSALEEKPSKSVAKMLYGGEQRSQDSLWWQGHTIANYTVFFSKCRQIAIVIIFSCNNDRYAYGRDNNDCCRQSRNTVGFFSTVRLPWLCTYWCIPQSRGDPPVRCVSGKSIPVARGTQRGDCAWRGICPHTPSILSCLLSMNQVNLHTAAATPVPPWSSSGGSSCPGCAVGLRLLSCSGGQHLAAQTFPCLWELRFSNAFHRESQNTQLALVRWYLSTFSEGLSL